jgi:hypothetical protein
MRISGVDFKLWIADYKLLIPDCGFQIHFVAAFGGANYTIKSNCIHSVFEGLSVTITEYCKKLA